ncbi:hypothetical protein B5F77_05515 [Parabacteroides sp. An277]|nr:hypothetical protein B5F77_05515 [Parabacteroides sp. An277]
MDAKIEKDGEKGKEAMEKGRNVTCRGVSQLEPERLSFEALQCSFTPVCFDFTSCKMCDRLIL